jgi:alpha-beta hydrolase superfamily lysophospholipase
MNGVPMNGIERDVRFTADDGWELGAVLNLPTVPPATPARDAPTQGLPGVVLVPGSLHVRDAWDKTAAALATVGLASLRIDVRGRGTSRGPLDHASMGPVARRRVNLDVAAAIRYLLALDEVDGRRLALVAEQDTSIAATEAAIDHATDAEPVCALALLSARGRPGRAWPHADRRPALPVLGLVSVEDRDGLRATVDAYLAGGPGSRLEVFHGLGIGITMASVQAFEHPDAQPIEDLIAHWIADTVGLWR